MIDHSILPQNKAELLRRIDDEWAALERLIESLTEEQMSKPDASGWTIKDNLAHIAIWEEFMRLHHLHNLPAHEVLDIDEGMYERGDEDEMNDIFWQRSKNRSASDVLFELRQVHEQMLVDLAQMSFADLMKQHYPDDPEASPVLCWVIGNTYEHYQEHRLTIEKFIKSGDVK
jgi:uncharacterized protein (TIGR03083 family)